MKMGVGALNCSPALCTGICGPCVARWPGVLVVRRTCDQHVACSISCCRAGQVVYTHMCLSHTAVLIWHQRKLGRQS